MRRGESKEKEEKKERFPLLLLLSLCSGDTCSVQVSNTNRDAACQAAVCLGRVITR